MKKLTILFTSMLLTKIAFGANDLNHFCYQDGLDNSNRLTIVWTDCFYAETRTDALKVCQKVADHLNVTTSDVEVITLNDRGRCTRLATDLIIANRGYTQKDMIFIDSLDQKLDLSEYVDSPLMIFHYSLK